MRRDLILIAFIALSYPFITQATDRGNFEGFCSQAERARTDQRAIHQLVGNYRSYSDCQLIIAYYVSENREEEVLKEALRRRGLLHIFEMDFPTLSTRYRVIQNKAFDTRTVEELGIVCLVERMNMDLTGRRVFDEEEAKSSDDDEI